MADIPLLAKEDYVQAASKAWHSTCLYLPTKMQMQKYKGVAENSEGYTYLVSRAGVTSAENQAHAANLDTLVETTQSPQSSTNSTRFWYCSTCSSKEALQLGAAGAISGSATVKIIERNLDNQAQCLSELAEFVRNMKAATK